MPPRRIRRIPASLASPRRDPLPRGADVRYCHGRCWTGETSNRFDDDHLVPDDRGSCKGPPGALAAPQGDHFPKSRRANVDGSPQTCLLPLKKALPAQGSALGPRCVSPDTVFIR